jgi:methyl-accepting chemotaxis protein
LVDKGGQIMQEVVASIWRSTDMVSAIAASGASQSKGITGVHDTIQPVRERT